ncbi:hypothetical protein Tco_1420163 [Tanacetum coccineum]
MTNASAASSRRNVPRAVREGDRDTAYRELLSREDEQLRGLICSSIYAARADGERVLRLGHSDAVSGAVLVYGVEYGCELRWEADPVINDDEGLLYRSLCRLFDGVGCERFRVDSGGVDVGEVSWESGAGRIVGFYVLDYEWCGYEVSEWVKGYGGGVQDVVDDGELCGGWCMEVEWWRGETGDEQRSFIVQVIQLTLRVEREDDTVEYIGRFGKGDVRLQIVVEVAGVGIYYMVVLYTLLDEWSESCVRREVGVLGLEVKWSERIRWEGRGDGGGRGSVVLGRYVMYEVDGGFMRVCWEGEYLVEGLGFDEGFMCLSGEWCVEVLCMSLGRSGDRGDVCGGRVVVEYLVYVDEWCMRGGEKRE